VSKAKSGRDSSGTYVVEFETVARRLKARVLDAVVRERWGDDAARVLNVVLKHGKMDEKHVRLPSPSFLSCHLSHKPISLPSWIEINQPPPLQIAKIAMLSPQSIRQITATLSSSSLLELQEVPKSADRQPSRTFYLWHVDLARAYTALISHLYKTLANLLQRKQKEVDERRMLVEKRNRSDVVESGGELMGREEKEELERMEQVVRRLTLAEQRTDLNIFVLRDLPGGPVGMMSWVVSCPPFLLIRRRWILLLFFPRCSFDDL
jgi:DNA-directed RNA polymerase III subunit RPC3